MKNLSPTLRAAIWILGSISAFTLMAVSGREIVSDLDTFEIMLYRSIIGVVIVLVASRLFGTLGQINTQQMGLHLVRNLTHFIGQNLWFYALAVIPLSQLFAFEFSTPIWVALLAPFFLQEKLTRVRAFCAVLGFIGILFVARPDTANVSPHVIAAILCAVGFAGASITTKLLTRTQPITCILFWLTAMQAVFGLICAGYDGDIHVPEGWNIVWLFVIGICGLGAHFCITRALELAPAIVVTPFDFLRLPLISVVAFLLYDEILEWPVVVGAIIVFVANLINIRTEMKLRKAAKLTI